MFLYLQRFKIPVQEGPEGAAQVRASWIRNAGLLSY